MSPGDPELVERDRDLASLVAALARAPAVAVVEGEPGIGKSRLVRAALADPALTGRQRLLGYARPTRGPCPLGPVIEALATADIPPIDRLSALSGALCAVLPDLTDMLPPAPPPPDDPQLARHRLVRATAELLSKLGSAVLVLEDLHWVDDATAELLGMIGAQPPPELSIAITYDSCALPLSSGLSALLAGSLGSSVAAHIRLAPLSASAAGRMTRELLGDPGAAVPRELADLLYERNGGVPQVVRDDVLLLRRRGLLHVADAEWTLRSGGETLDGEPGSALSAVIPPAVSADIITRTGSLSAAAGAALNAAAVLAEPAEPELVARVAGMDVEQATAALGEATQRGLLRDNAPHGTAVTFRHELARLSIYQAISSPLRRRLHAVAAQELAAQAPTAQELAAQERAAQHRAVREVAGQGMAERIDAPGMTGVGGTAMALALRVVEHYRLAGDIAGWVRSAESAADLAADSGSFRAAHACLRDILEAGAVPEDKQVEIAIKLGWTALGDWTALSDADRTRTTAVMLAAAQARDIASPAQRAELRLLRVWPHLDGVGSGGREPEPIGPDAVGPDAVGPEIVGSNVLGSQAVGSRAVGSRAVGSRAVRSIVIGSRVTGSRVAGSHVTGSDNVRSSVADDFVAELRAAIGDLGRRPDLQAIALATLAIPTRLPGLDVSAQMAYLSQARAVLDRTTDPLAHTAVLTTSVHMLLTIGSPDGWPAVDALPTRGDRAHVKRQIIRGLLNAAEAALHLGHYPRSLELVTRGLQLAADARLRTYDPGFLAAGLRVRWTMGEAIADEHVSRLAHDPDADGGLHSRLLSAQMLIGRGRFAAARRSLRAVADEACAVGELAVAAHAAAEFNRAARTTADRRLGYVLARLVRDALAVKQIWICAAPLLPFAELDVVSAMLPGFRGGLPGRDVPLARAALGFADARLSERDGDVNRALTGYRVARECYAALPDPRMAAHAGTAEVRCQLAAGQTPNAQLLRDAWRTFTDLGAGWDADRVKQLMRRAGLPAPHRRGRPGYGNQLSPREREVAALAAVGHTNRDIAAHLYLSDRTVKYHLANAMRKLDVSNRRQLSDVLEPDDTVSVAHTPAERQVPAGPQEPVENHGRHTCRCARCGRELNPS
jgi:DNA-binding CsgD family transcriptional regulator